MAIKDFLRGKNAAALPNADGPRTSSPTEDSITEKGQYDDESHVPFLSIHSFFMAILVSMGWSSVSLGKSGLEIASGLSASDAALAKFLASSPRKTLRINGIHYPSAMFAPSSLSSIH